MNVRRAFDLALLVSLTILGCSWLVDPREEHPRCVPDPAGPVCPPGLECQDGRCQKACRRDVPDICNDNLDNDCDGAVDEADPEGRETCGDGVDNDCDQKVDEGFDLDEDGFRWCGVTTSGGGPMLTDCDDANEEMYPGAPETCDGRDNDCDQKVDEAPPGESLCAPGLQCIQRCVVPSCAIEASDVKCKADERCDAATGQCVTISKQCAEITCGANEECDEETGTCRMRPKLANGAACTLDNDCASNTCMDAAAMRLATGIRICGKACCSNVDCTLGEECVASGTGARSCLPIELAPGNPRQCTIDDDCGDPELCALSREQRLAAPVFQPREQLVTSTCGPDPTPDDQVGARCGNYTDCETKVCVRVSLLSAYCSTPCGRSLDCAAFGEAVPGTAAPYCRYIDVTLENVEGGPLDYAAVCVVPRGETLGTGRYGDLCASANDCQDGGCVGATAAAQGRCSPTCCKDAQCGFREDGQPITCRPFAFGARYEMRCNIQ